MHERKKLTYIKMLNVKIKNIYINIFQILELRHTTAI